MREKETWKEKKIKMKILRREIFGRRQVNGERNMKFDVNQPYKFMILLV